MVQDIKQPSIMTILGQLGPAKMLLAQILLCIPDESGAIPSVKIVALVPIDAAIHVSHNGTEIMGMDSLQ